jgi:glc operon protein GlcG
MRTALLAILLSCIPASTALAQTRDVKDGVQHASLDIAIEKARTSARFRRPSMAMAEAVGRGVVGLVGTDGMLMMEGALPVTVDGVVVGAVGISGITGAQDAEIAAAGIAALQIDTPRR